MSWTFYKNEKIEIINYYNPEIPDTVTLYGTIFSALPSYTFKKYRKSGSLEFTGEIKKGKKNGEWFYYDSKGILFKKETFVENKIISKVSF